MEPDFQRDHAFFAKINALVDPLSFKVPEVDRMAVFSSPYIVQVEARHERVGSSPFARNHDIVARLVPEIVIVVHAGNVVFPAPDNLEILIEMQEPARRFASGVAQHGDDDVRAQAMHGMRSRKVGFFLDLLAFDDLVQFGCARIRDAIDNMQP